MRIKATILAYAFLAPYFKNTTIVAYACLRVKDFLVTQGVLVYICAFDALVLMSTWCCNGKINSMITKGTPIILSRSHFN